MKALIPLITLAAAGSAYSASFYIGDAAPEGMAVTDSGSVDTANGGTITYGVHSSPYTNTSGSTETLTLTEVNFWSDAPTGSVTPYVALYNNLGIAPAANYTFLSIGDTITAVGGLNNAAFNVGGSNPNVSLNNGDTIIAGWYQTPGVVPFANAGAADYLDEANELGAGVGGTFGEDAQWSNLGRTYAFNIGFEVVPIPEPSAALLLPAALGGVLLVRRRRK